MASGDADWWQRHLEVLRTRSAELRAEVAEQQAELARIHASTEADRVACEAWEAKARGHAEVEHEAACNLEAELAAVSRACRENAALAAQRRSLLRAIATTKRELGREALAAHTCAGEEARTAAVRRVTTKRSSDLRRVLQELGDKQAGLAKEETDERSKRRELRHLVRERLNRFEGQQAEMERRLANRDAEIESWRARLERSKAAERAAVQEAAQLRAEVERCEGPLTAQWQLEREELRRQLHDATAADERLRGELHATRERIRRREQHEREYVGAKPWAPWVEAAPRRGGASEEAAAAADGDAAAPSGT